MAGTRDTTKRTYPCQPLTLLCDGTEFVLLTLILRVLHAVQAFDRFEIRGTGRGAPQDWERGNGARVRGGL